MYVRLGLDCGAGTVLALNKLLEALAIVPIVNEGMSVAASGGDIAPYILALLMLVIAILVPKFLIEQ